MTDGVKRLFQEDSSDDDGEEDDESGVKSPDNGIGSALSRTNSVDGKANTDVESGNLALCIIDKHLPTVGSTRCNHDNIPSHLCKVKTLNI